MANNSASGSDRDRPDTEGPGAGAPSPHGRVRRRIRRWRSNVPRLSRFAVEHLLLLPLGAAIALVWANTAPESYFRFTFSIAFAVNSVAMVFFFALMTKEVVEATAPNGVLHPWRRALLPVAAAIGATMIPALVHVRAVEALEEPMLAVGWPVTFATDLAVSYFVARLIFGLHAAVPFLLLLGIASDALAFLALAVVHPTGDTHLPRGAAIMAAALAVAYILRRARLRSFWPYIVLAGSVSWAALFLSGLHPGLALVPIMPFMPHAARDPGFFVDARPTARDALSQFELVWKYPVQVTLFFFGLVNAGVRLHAFEAGAWGVPAAVIVGKPIGIFLAVGAALAAGLRLPSRIGWRDLIVIGFTAAIGFSIALFIADALLPPGQLRTEIAISVLISLVAAPLAVVAAWVLGVGRFAPK
jgi:NhaA family Na+:H+ antiporter